MADRDSGSSLERVRQWLQKQGYSLEMRAAQAFERAGFEISQSSPYLDPETNNLREMDVVASLGRKIDDMWASVIVFVECKYANNPWVVFTAQRRLHPLAYFSRVLAGKYDVHSWQMQNTLQGRLLASILSSLSREAVGGHVPFRLPPSIGYRIAEAHMKEATGKDSAYSALMQVSSCVQAHDIAMEFGFGRSLEDYGETDRPGPQSGRFPLFCGIGLPVVLVRGKLYECCLNPDGEISLTETDNSIVSVSGKAYLDEQARDSSVSIVRVITEGYLDSFAQEALAAGGALLAQEEAIRDVWRHEYSKLPQRPEPDEIPF